MAVHNSSIDQTPAENPCDDSPHAESHSTMVSEWSPTNAGPRVQRAATVSPVAEVRESSRSSSKPSRSHSFVAFRRLKALHGLCSCPSWLFFLSCALLLLLIVALILSLSLFFFGGGGRGKLPEVPFCCADPMPETTRSRISASEAAMMYR